MTTSEQLLQVVPQKLGRYLYYRLGETTINQLVEFGLIPKRDYGELIGKKPDGLIVLHKQVKGVVESKPPSELNSEAKAQKAIEQEVSVAKKLCKLLIVTDNVSNTVWINALNGERIKGKTGAEITALFDSKLTKNVNEVARLIEEIDSSVSATNSTLLEEKLIDPSDLARSMWQTIWVATGKSPIKCLYNVVELLIFKFLSDLKVLEEEYDFNKVWGISQRDPEEALTFYARNSRKKILTLFPVGKDETTIINGTIFVNEKGEANLSQAILFHHSLKHLYDYGYNFGSFVKIDKNFKTKLYETFLQQEVEALGQYFTTRKIVQSIVRLSGLDEEGFDFQGKRICDPFCGVGGFLLEILNLNDRMKECYTPDDNDEIHLPFVLNGFDKGFEREDERTIILAKANMLIYLSDIVFKYPKLTKVFAKVFNDTFTLFRDNLATFAYIIKDEDKKYDFILTNPPYVTHGSSIIKEELKSKALKKEYPVNAVGLEGLSIEWIIRSLKRGGKAFIILPDGVMDRLPDRKLRSHIARECFVDGIISLPVRTFFANERKTYILALTKKQSPLDVQKHGVFTYLISDIGEDLTKKTRDDITKNDLAEMEQLFAMFSAVKNDATAYRRIEGNRCKIIAPDTLFGSKDWRVERRWSREELLKLGLVAEEVDLEDVITALDDAKKRIDKLTKLTFPAIPTGRVKRFKVLDLFKTYRGTSKYNKKYFKSHHGPYPVISSQTSGDGINGFIDTYAYDVGAKGCLTWTLDGVYAGTVFLREGKFNMSQHARSLVVKDEYSEDIYLPYMYHVLKGKLRKFAVGQEDQNRRVTVDVIKDVEIDLPLREDGKIDKKWQQEAALKFSENELALDEAIQAKDELILLLKRALGR